MISQMQIKVGVTALVAVTLCFAPQLVMGQGTAQHPSLLSVDFDNVDVEEALEKLFKQAGKKVEFAPGVSGTVSAHVHDASFQSALEAILRESTRHLTFRIENEKYTIEPANEVAGGLPSKTYNTTNEAYSKEQSKNRFVILQFNFAQTAKLIKSLRTDRKSLVPAGITFAAGEGNSLLVTYKDEDALRDFKQLIRAVDKAPIGVDLRADLVVEVGGGHSTKSYGVINMLGHSIADKPFSMRMAVDRASASVGTLKLERGELSMRITPHVMGDASVLFETDWSLDISLRPARGGKAAHITRKSAGSFQVSNGNTEALAKSAVQLGDSSAGREAKLSLFVTPSVILDPRPISLFTSPTRMSTIIMEPVDSKRSKVLADAMQMMGVLMAEVNGWEVLRPDEVLKSVKDVAVTPPYDLFKQNMLGRVLGADVFVGGTITNGRDGKPVSLSVKMRDLKTNAIRTAFAKLEPGPTTESLPRAAKSIVRQLESYQPLEGAILTRFGKNQVLVNLGTANGILRGSELRVIQEGRRIGTLQVSRTFGGYCEAAILDGAGAIQSEDTVQAYVKGRIAPVASPTGIRP